MLQLGSVNWGFLDDYRKELLRGKKKLEDLEFLAVWDSKS